jgi:hypothetical protein
MGRHRGPLPEPLPVPREPRTSAGDAHDVLPHGARSYTYTQYMDGQPRRAATLTARSAASAASSPATPWAGPPWIGPSTAP